jgi:hypothetical protein
VQLLRRWLDLRAQRRPLALRASREVIVPLEYDAAFDRVLASVERDLGATLSENDRTAGRIVAAFGLVHNERVRCLLQREDSERTRVRIEALPPAGVAATRSAAVDAMAAALEAGA